jgi:hypothetical protein
MKIDRRTFILGTGGLVAVGPALAGLRSLPTFTPFSAASLPDALPPSATAIELKNPDGIAFGIIGWTLHDSAPAAGTVLFNVGQSWKTAWR